jgi:ATP-dependent DNA ligase
MQRIADTAQARNVGRSNEVSAEESAVQQMDRTVKKKMRGGYVEVGAEATEGQGDEILFDQQLPSNLCFYKPDNTLSKRLEKLLDEGHAWLTRKRDGEMMVLYKMLDGTVEVYSRRMHISHHLEVDTDWRWRHRFMHIVEELEDSDVPPGSIILGEITSSRTKDKRWHTAKVMKSLTPEAIDLQNQEGDCVFYCWDIAFANGVAVLTVENVSMRILMADKWFDEFAYIMPIQVLHSEIVEIAMDFGLKRVVWDANPDQAPGTWDSSKSNMWNAACWYADREGWEGFVVVDPCGVYGDKAYNFRGKPDRPGKYSGKLKPEYEDDFIALFNPDDKCGKWGRGKRQGQVGSVELHQYNSAGELIYICDCGGGLIKRDVFAEAHSSPDDYPMVLKVKYSGRTYISQGEKTNALQFPRVIEIRTDKALNECINERLL